MLGKPWAETAPRLDYGLANGRRSQTSKYLDDRRQQRRVRLGTVRLAASKVAADHRPMSGAKARRRTKADASTLPRLDIVGQSLLYLAPRGSPHARTRTSPDRVGTRRGAAPPPGDGSPPPRAPPPAPPPARRDPRRSSKWELISQKRLSPSPLPRWRAPGHSTTSFMTSRRDGGRSDPVMATGPRHIAAFRDRMITHLAAKTDAFKKPLERQGNAGSPVYCGFG